MTTTPASSGPTTPATTPAPAANPAVTTAVVMLSGLPRGLPSATRITASPPDPEADQWAAKINGAFGEGLGWILDAGSYLIQAKAALPHGRWTAMFESGRIKFGIRHATMLMRIAAHRALSNQQYLAELPHCLTTLDVLAGGSAEVIEAGIKAGVIGPELTAKEAKSFLRAHSPKLATRTRVVAFNQAKRLEHTERLLTKELEKWPYEAVGPLADLLANYAHDLRLDLPHTERQP